MFGETLLLKIVLGCVAVLLFIALFGAIRRELKRMSAICGGVPMVAKAVLLACGVSFYLHGSMKTNNTTNAASPMMFAARPGASQLETVNETEMYVNAWNITGVWQDSFWCRFENGFVFPFGTNHLKGVEVLAWGEIWSTHRKDAVLADLGEKVAIGRGISRFSCEYFAASETNEAKYVYSWYNGLVNRETNSVINGRIELRRSGDILVATNGVERFIPRQLPFEHNGFGQDNEWVAANFTNANEILSLGYSQWVDDQVGVGLTNGLYKLTVAVPEVPPETTQLKVGDYSVAVTNAGEYVFLLEKGVTYPLSVYGIMDGLEYEWDDGGGVEMPSTYGLPRNISNYEVEVSSYCDLDNPVFFNAPTDEGDGFIHYYPIVTISPSYKIDPGEPLCLFAFVADNISPPYADIKWIADNRVIGTGEFLFIHDLSLYTYIDVEVRYRDSLVNGWVCINRYVKDTIVDMSGGGVIVTEGAYTNSPNEVVSASSTSVNLNVAYQLTEGGAFKLECDDPSGLEVRDDEGEVVTLPVEWSGYYNEDASRTYSVAASDVEATGKKTFSLTFTPYPGGDPIVRHLTVDVVKIRVEAEADWPSNKVRHVFGPGERFSIVSTGSIFLNANMNGVNVDGNRIVTPEAPGSFFVDVSHNDFRSTLMFSCVGPTKLIGKNPRPLESHEWLSLGIYPFSVNEAGVIMYIETVVEPSFVSFKHIRLYEGFALPTAREGWYLDKTKFPDSFLQHDGDAGQGSGTYSGSEGVLDIGNKTENGDFVGGWIGTSSGYANGSYQLAIPLKWFVEGGSITNNMLPNVQKVSVFSNGSMRVEKNGIVWERSLDGREGQVLK